jgi:hypothetical protein
MATAAESVCATAAAEKSSPEMKEKIALRMLMAEWLLLLRACSGFSAGGKNRQIFCQFLRF